MAVLIGRVNQGAAPSAVEYFSTRPASTERDKTLVSTSTIRGIFDRLATIASPVSGDPPASARFLTLGVGKYSSLSLNDSELPTRTMSGIGSLTYLFNVISEPSRVVVAGS